MVAAATGGAPIPKEVVIGFLGSSAGVSGLVLVFAGLVITTAGRFPGDVPDAARAPFRRAAWYAVAVFGLGLASAGASLSWLALGGGQALYYGTITLFVLTLAGVLLLAIAVVRELLY